MSQIVKLQYFKPTGKWYESDSFVVPDNLSIWEIWGLVKQKARDGNLPGLVLSTTPYKYHITVDVPGHKNEHPHLIIAESI